MPFAPTTNTARLCLLVSLSLSAMPPTAAGEGLKLTLRDRFAASNSPADFQVRERHVEWDPHQIAIVICDMWNQHWCASATRRVAEMAPAMNQVLEAARAQGVLIVHAPSDCLDAYADTPQRRWAKEAKPRPAVGPRRIAWDKPLDTEPGLPIDDSDGGCDCQPQCAQGSPWRSQIAALRIAPEDAISDSGEEILNLFAEREIQFVVVMGVHTNMCVLGRSFGLRQMARAGLHVMLARDLTDTMYNPRRAPHVDHRRGTELVVEHIEKYVCPSIHSSDLVSDAPAPRAMFMIGEDEYDTQSTLPEFSRTELVPRGWECNFVVADEDDPHDFAGIENVAEADVLVISVRRRTPTAEQLAAVRAYLDAGRPLVGIRTASHAFDREPPPGHESWPTFDIDVLGGDYQGHYGNKSPDGPHTLIDFAADATSTGLLRGVQGPQFEVTSHLYKNRDLGPATRLLLIGRVVDQETKEPVAWTNSYKGGRVFYTSLGNPADFQRADFRRLLINGLYWSIERAAPAVPNP